MSKSMQSTQIPILIFIPMWKRRRITDWSLRSLEEALAFSPWIKPYRLAVTSRPEDASFALQRGFAITHAENDAERLGEKFNAGMAAALQTRGYDFVFQMNSDTILARDFFEHAKNRLTANEPFFGINVVGFVDTGLSAEDADVWPPPSGTRPADFAGKNQNKGSRFQTRETNFVPPIPPYVIAYNYTAGCGIRFIRRDIIEQAGWMRYATPLRSMSAPRASYAQGEPCWVPRAHYKPEKFADGPPEVFRLWPPLPRGLDNASHRAITSVFPHLARHPFIGEGQMLALDAKSGQNLWGIENFADGPSEVFRIGPELLARFPALGEIFADFPR